MQAGKTVNLDYQGVSFRFVLHDEGKSLEAEATATTTGDFYANAWDDSTFSPAAVFGQLEDKKFSVAFSKGECVLQLEGGAKLKLSLAKSLDDTEKLLRRLRAVEEERRWKRVGVITEFDELVKQYPFAEWKWGGTYNNINPLPLIITNWNRGVRVTFKHFYPQGDDGAALSLGNAVWTRGTDDPETQSCKNPDGTPGFYHRYVNTEGKPGLGANGNSPLSVWVKRY